jgi:hypothetical protein
VKRKRVYSQQEEEEQNAHENDILLDDMDLDVDIESIQFKDEEESAQENVQCLALVVQDEVLCN